MIPSNTPGMHSFTYGNCITVGLISSSTNTVLGDGGGFVRTKPKPKGSYQCRGRSGNEVESKATLPAVTGVMEIELDGEDTADTAVVRAEWARESGERECV